MSSGSSFSLDPLDFADHEAAVSKAAKRREADARVAEMPAPEPPQDEEYERRLWAAWEEQNWWHGLLVNVREARRKVAKPPGAAVRNYSTDHTVEQFQGALLNVLDEHIAKIAAKAKEADERYEAIKRTSLNDS